MRWAHALTNLELKWKRKHQKGKILRVTAVMRKRLQSLVGFGNIRRSHINRKKFILLREGISEVRWWMIRIQNMVTAVHNGLKTLINVNQDVYPLVKRGRNENLAVVVFRRPVRPTQRKSFEVQVTLALVVQMSLLVFAPRIPGVN